MTNRLSRGVGLLILCLGLSAAACSNDRNLGQQGNGGSAGASSSSGSSSSSSSGSSSVGTGMDPVKEQQKATLDACGFPTPCPSVQATILWPSDEWIFDCIDTALGQGGPVHLTFEDVPDGGGDCKTLNEIYVGQDGTVIHWWRLDNDCSSAVSYTYGLERCQVQAPSYFAACGPKDAGPPDQAPNSCGLINDWFTLCSGLDMSACP
jgi:hypothetical protein